MPNRLQTSSSAYLKSAAHQPIDWHEFGKDAFALAREQDKPILLDIGAVWCHWCHVIDRESYDNPEIAALINEHYIPVKVDRDQRPDVDARYQQVVQATTGQGGWPLTAFLTHDGRLIYGGTYFPPQAMKNLLEKIQQVYRERKEEIFRPAEMLTGEQLAQAANGQLAASAAGLREPAEAVDPIALKKLCGDFLELIFSGIRRQADPVHGGFGERPKFPHFSTLELMMNHICQNPDSRQYLEILEKTLTEMARGGVYDQIAGGFHRYSVDERWHVPHFEKMAYDNAEALKVYAQAYRLTGIPLFREIAQGIIAWIGETLSDPEHGGFFGSQDADIDLEDDGDHFTWSPDELREILTPQEIEVVSRHYDINEVGDMHHARGRNVLYIHQPAGTIARELGIPLETVDALLVSAKGKMLAKRRLRPMPFVDRTLYTNWNGMQIAAWFVAADLLDLPDARDFAAKSLDLVLDRYYEPRRQVLHADGVPGFLEDYAWLALATLKGYQSTENAHYLTVTRELADLLLLRFEDVPTDGSAGGGFLDLPHDERTMGLLQFKRKPVEDSPSSSANAIALQVLDALYYLTGDERYRTSLERGLNLLIHLNGQYGLFVSALGLAAAWYQSPPLKLEVVSPDHALKAAARHIAFPGKIVSYASEAETNEIRVCVGSQCLAPVSDAQALQAQVDSLCTAPISL